MKNRSSSPQLKRSGQTPKTQEPPETTTTTLREWIHRHLGRKGIKIAYRTRGNILHILCEATECPPMDIALQKLKTALDTTDTDTLPPEISGQETTHAIYQIILYGRKQGDKQASWSVRIDPPAPHPPIQESPRLPVKRSPSLPISPSPLPPLGEGIEEGATLVRAIARYLGEILSPFGVGVGVQIRPLKTTAEQSFGVGPLETPNPTKAQKRLWVFCTSAYSPDPALLVEPLAQRLRNLHLEGFRDALILGQVTGETKPEWLLRIDLTPPEQQLAAWARWGDIPALTRLLGQKLTPLGLQVSGVIEDSTLHLFFSKSRTELPARRGTIEAPAHQDPLSNSKPEYPGAATSDKETVKACIQPVLESIAPQGIIGATLYGQLAEESPPVWVDWLDLPAGRHVELAATVLDRAAAGDLEAITFLLDRQLNPDLDRKLISGGLQVAIRRVTKNTLGGDILHVLVDNPVSPPDRAVGLALANLIANLKIEGLTGVRIYGRVCGRVQPLWRHKVDFADDTKEPGNTLLLDHFTSGPGGQSPSLPPGAAVGSGSPSQGADISAPPHSSVLDSEFTVPVSNSEDLQTFLTKQLQNSRERATNNSHSWLRQLLIATHGFLPAKSIPTAATAGPAVTLVWLTLGLLTLVQVDWFLASLVRGSRWRTLSELPHQEQVETIPQDEPECVRVRTLTTGDGDGETTGDGDGETTGDGDGETGGWGDGETGISGPCGTLGGDRAVETGSGVFDNSGFTEATATQTPSKRSVPQAEPLPLPSYPTFNSQQLDKQLANYLRYVAEGGPADVLIVGSSRALRGVDPAILAAALEETRPGLRIFNFGINGATAQVVEWLLRDLLAPEYLPKLILWADGARAFNSGRADRTMEAIVASPGYKALQQGNRPTIPNPHSAKVDNADGTATAQNTKGLDLAAAYEELDKFFVSKITSLSASYGSRSDLLKLLGSKIHISRSGLPGQPQTTPETETGIGNGVFQEQSQPDAESDGTESANGFLPYPKKFDPYTYYEQYALVTGAYDADYQSFQLLGKQDEAMQNILQFTREQDISLVFINTPLTMGYLDSVRLAYEREFQQYILALAIQHQFLFKDFSELWPTQNDYFSDPSHLNRFGAAEVARKLARDALISWPKNPYPRTNDK